jgi:hypothetical protein
VSLDEYATLRRYDGTLPMSEASELGRQCRTSAVYVHYCNRQELEPYVIAAAENQRLDWLRQQCLDVAHHLSKGTERWICVYVGEAAVSLRGRTAAKRFRHEFGLAGYFQQAPALDALCSILYKERKWTPVCKVSTGGKIRTYLRPEDKREFLNWCARYVRCAWLPIDCDTSDAKRKVRGAEVALIFDLKPLLNVKESRNPFARFVTTARQRFHSESRRGQMILERTNEN